MRTEPNTTTTLEPVLLRAPEAAQFLGISERLLWSLRASGKIKVRKIGRATRFHVEELRRWAAAEND